MSPIAAAREWTGVPDRRRLVLRIAAFVVVVTLAYHYSLASLMQNLGADTPLAYLGLVPVISIVLAGLVAVRRRAEPDIHDRQLDYIIGLPLVAIALAMMIILPVRMSSLFWSWRLDLLSLPIFVAGSISILFGVRALWRFRVPILFLILAWPLPYTVLIGRWLSGFTSLTAEAVGGALHFIPVADRVAGGDGSLFSVARGSGGFLVSIASACAGVNGMVGFLLVGGAFAALARGRRLPKTVWLVSGMLLLWLLNLGRIVLILAIGSRWGEKVAIEGFHPFVGLLAFNAGVLGMIVAARLFGLHFAWPTPRAGVDPRQPARDERPEDAPPAPDVARRPARRSSAVPRAAFALALVLAAGSLLGVANAGLKEYDLVADDLGAPRLADFTSHPTHVRGWFSARTGEYPWAKRYFGDDSTWRRYTYVWNDRSGAITPYRSNAPIFVDVISTSNLRTFSQYGLEACYRFHGYRITDTRTVDLGGGVTGTVVSYLDPGRLANWTTLFWHWPVRTPGGVRYERVVVMMIDTLDASLMAPPLEPSLARRLGIGLSNALRGGTSARLSEKLVRTRNFVVGFGQTILAEQVESGS